MPTDIADLLEAAAGPLPRSAPEAAILRRAGARRSRRRAAQVALSLVLLIAVPVAVLNVVSRTTVEFAPADQPNAPGGNHWCAAAPGDAEPDGGGCVEVVNRADNLRFQVPDGWHQSSGVVNHGVRELPAFTTAALDPALAFDAACLVPVLSEMGEDGAAVAVLTASDAQGLEFPPRPKVFTFADAAAAPPFGAACGAPPNATIAWFSFRDGGRKFHAVAAAGPDATAGRRKAALQVLNSMEVVRPDPSR